ncbi:DUF5994 family protein [Streptomyces cinnamoneus]|uniref:Uncharacterized protein n=1 Tax=Streptomyces cinnamoneus TaxID=53446 RepID=A0A918WQY7_STRCJ|nr:hypothetical protein GCM10010507_53410 [Streptomyces cinnamoneus]
MRLSLTPKTPLAGLLDGAWWPHTRDLTAELPPLASVLDAVRGRITRVTVHPGRRPVIPRKVPAGGDTVHVGWVPATGRRTLRRRCDPRRDGRFRRLRPLRHPLTRGAVARLPSTEVTGVRERLGAEKAAPTGIDICSRDTRK